MAKSAYEKRIDRERNHRDNGRSRVTFWVDQEVRDAAAELLKDFDSWSDLIRHLIGVRDEHYGSDVSDVQTREKGGYTFPPHIYDLFAVEARSGYSKQDVVVEALELLSVERYPGGIVREEGVLVPRKG